MNLAFGNCNGGGVGVGEGVGVGATGDVPEEDPDDDPELELVPLEDEEPVLLPAAGGAGGAFPIQSCATQQQTCNQRSS